MRTIPCATPGCPHPAREVGWPADCEKCGKTLCETCCDKREAEKRAARGGR